MNLDQGENLIYVEVYADFGLIQHVRKFPQNLPAVVCAYTDPIFLKSWCHLPNGNKTRALSEDKCLDMICTNSFLCECISSTE